MYPPVHEAGMPAHARCGFGNILFTSSKTSFYCTFDQNKQGYMSECNKYTLCLISLDGLDQKNALE